MVFIAQGIRLELLTTAPMYSSNSLQVDFLYPNIKKMNNPIVFCEKNYIFAIEKEI